MTPMDGDLVIIPEGYHPAGAPAGYDCYYLNVMPDPTGRSTSPLTRTMPG